MWISQINYVRGPYAIFSLIIIGLRHILRFIQKKVTSCTIQNCLGIEENDNIVFSSAAKPTNPNLLD